MRDTVSGAVVRGDSLLYKDDDGLPFSPPTQLHIRNATEGRLGGLSFNGKMLWCLSKGTIKPERHRDYAESHWWVGDEVERDLRATFRQRDLVDIVLMVLRDGTPWDKALDGTDWDIRTVKCAMRKMKKHIISQLDRQQSA